MKCKLCMDGEKIRARKSILMAHTLSKRHSKSCMIHNLPVITDFTLPAVSTWSRKKAIAEIKYAAMFVMFGLSFKISNSMAKILDSIDPESIFGLLKVGSTKIRDIAVKVIAETAKLELAKVLREANFTISVDESTDSSKDKILVIVVRFVNSSTGKIVSYTWDMPKLFLDGKEANSSAESILRCIVKSFSDYEIPMWNIFACSTDGCSAMLGDSGGLKGLMLKSFPHIIWIPCPAHITHLCGSHGMTVLPKTVVELIINFHKMVRSANRKKNFENIQIALGLPTHRIPRFVATRWLSIEHCVNRALQQWPALLVFAYTLKKKNEKIGIDVFNAMTKPDIKLYFYLIQNVYSELNHLNKFYQCKDVIIPICAEQAEKTFKKLLERFMDAAEVEKIDPKNINLFDVYKLP